MGDPLVSVVINNYNYARFLRQAIDSVLAQTYPRVELVVVDDGSTDDSADVIRSYGDRLKAVFKPNGGQGSACNRGFAESSGDWVLFLDSDDWYFPHAVERIVETASRMRAALIQFRMDVVNEKGTRIGGPMPAPSVRFDSGDVVPVMVSRGYFIGTVTSANAFRRDALQKVLPMPEAAFRRAADGYLINTVPFHGTVGVIEEPLGAYRLHSRNVHGIRSSRRIETARVRERLEWTVRELALVEHGARVRGIPVPRQLAMHYMGHLQWRIMSYTLDPEHHPFPEDAAWKLGLWGFLAALRDRSIEPCWRAFMAAWFPLVGFLPRAAARSVLALKPGD